MSKSYRDLLVWRKSFTLAKDVYIYTAQLPGSEKYGIVSQIQRAAISIPSNIAEGQQRGGPKEFRQFLFIARGSAAELSTQLQLAQEIYETNAESLLEEVEQIQKMLYALISKL
jgi:four helix bundle protein